MTKKRKDKRALVGRVASEGVKVAGGLGAVGFAVLHPELAPLASIANVLFPRIVDGGGGLVGKALEGRAARRMRLWFENVAAAQAFGTPERVAEVVAERIESPEAQDALAEAYRAIRESLDEAAMPVIAALTAEQLAHGRAPDANDRAVARMVGEMDAPLIGAMRRLLQGYTRSESEWGAARFIELTLVRGSLENGEFRDRGSATVAHRDVIVRMKINGMEQRWYAYVDQRSEPELFRLLKTHGFGTGGETAVQDAVIGGYVVMTHAETLRRLIRYFVEPFQALPSPTR